MSVRRLAEESIQPETFKFSKENLTWARAKMKEYPKGRQQSAVIPLLFRAQEQEGWVSRPIVETVAEMLDMPFIRVLEVATFYTQFQLQPVGTKAHIQVCGTTPCMLRGAEDIRAVCQKKIHAEPHHTNADGTLSWEEVECMGACVNAPMIAIGHDTYEDLTVEAMEKIIDAFAAGDGDRIQPGPQNGRIYSAAITGQTTLTDLPKKKNAKANGAGSKSQSPTKPGRKRDIPPEGAPAVEGPDDSAKVSEGEAEAERKQADKAANANGKPNRAGRPAARGAGSEGGKRDHGAAVGKSAKSDGTGASPLFETPAGGKDDLKLISGVGPVLEKKLNNLGVTQFAQVAKFKKADINKLDDALSFKGRIERDEWVKQAKALAKGGVEEYVRVFGKKPR